MPVFCLRVTLCFWLCAYGFVDMFPVGFRSPVCSCWVGLLGSATSLVAFVCLGVIGRFACVLHCSLCCSFPSGFVMAVDWWFAAGSFLFLVLGSFPGVYCHRVCLSPAGFLFRDCLPLVAGQSAVHAHVCWGGWISSYLSWLFFGCRLIVGFRLLVLPGLLLGLWLVRSGCRPSLFLWAPSEANLSFPHMWPWGL